VWGGSVHPGAMSRYTPCSTWETSADAAAAPDDIVTDGEIGAGTEVGFFNIIHFY